MRGSRWACARPRMSAVVALSLLLLICGIIGDAAKLRHSRHSAAFGAGSQYTNEYSTNEYDIYFGGNVNSTLTKDQSNNHNHKPVFSNCSRYAPFVKEEEQAGTAVITVRAEDRDAPAEGGTITYSFVMAPDEKLKFEINNRTGVITTTQVLDRDEPAREKEVYLTVLAVDNGLPQLDDACTFKVTILDINDNAPVFDKVAYSESVPQDLAVGSEVMRVSATDIDDGNNSVVRYSIKSKHSDESDYFRIDRNTGVIFLNKSIDKEADYKFSMTATAEDVKGTPPIHHAIIDINIQVVDSNKKAPSFLPRSNDRILLPENFNNFGKAIVVLNATSNIEHSPDLVFEMATGRNEATNKGNIFTLDQVNRNSALVKLGSALDYERNTEYTLIVRVKNDFQLAAETIINIEVLDVNDNKPIFREMVKGSILENEPAGTPVMQVRAIDADGTPENNQVTYKLLTYDNLFAIDSVTGNITSRTMFDRELKDSYSIKILATDNSPSALLDNGEPNTGTQFFRIEIADKNDNPPKFSESRYVANTIPEDANINAIVTEVKAIDADTASPVTYSITYGNTNDSFYIENTTGKIRVMNPLDYEKITEYTLTVKAFDGIYYDTTQVHILIDNVNDNPPQFEYFDKNLIIREETMVEGCITNVVAYDPDIFDRNADQHIAYSIDNTPMIDIDKNGCMTLKKPLDRDHPNGYPVWNVRVSAVDEDGGPTGKRKIEYVNITLLDINDNAPFLDMPYPVIWYENEIPDKIVDLKARDHDSDENGPPFTFRIDSSASRDITSKFDIRNASLYAKVQFDREEKKSYNIPLAITDNGKPPMTGTSTLTVIIGDKNDNRMEDGDSTIFIYNYMGNAPSVEIGRVYVNDPDDWDLLDKHFSWAVAHDGFELDPSTGMITLLSGTSNGTFVLQFTVSEEAAEIPRHTVTATVNVTVKEIPEEAIQKSGSIRLLGISAEEFIAPEAISKKDILQERLATMFNTSIENVDVFTVLHSPYHNNSVLDVRFSAHGSPYYAPEKLNTIVVQNLVEIERRIGAEILLVNIDECLDEKVHCNHSCRSVLNVSPMPYSVFTNTTSFVGVKAIVDPVCKCIEEEALVCLNGGTVIGNRCECVPGYNGPRCELWNIGFQGDGWAIMESPSLACEESTLSLELTTQVQNGLVFYMGPMYYTKNSKIQDFMALELHNGLPLLYVDYGTGTARLDQKMIYLSDGKKHSIDIIWTKTAIEMKIDGCSMSACMSLTAPNGTNEFLNVNSPLQVGGSAFDLGNLAAQYGWAYRPTDKGFVGCIWNMTLNGKTFNLGMPSFWKNADFGCSTVKNAAVTFGIDTSFLVALAVCVALLLILLLAFVVHRRKTDDLYKDLDDPRENIINYQDEGGGEVDAGYDLNVFRGMYEPPCDSKIAQAGLQCRGTDEVPDMCGFLDGKKECCDKDPETNPFDDVRHYAYEGEGNSDGSLSSLASCTDDGDLKFNYLSNFGPRFRKLADMYGEEPSDEESEGVGERESESWC